MSKFIDMTPTWEEAVRLHLVCLEYGDNPEARDAAKQEIIRCAKLLDQYQQRETEIPEADQLRHQKEQEWAARYDQDTQDLY